MNNGNLIPNSQRSREELQEMGRRGGIASGKARRRKRELKKLCRRVLRDTVKDMIKGWHLPEGARGNDQ